MGERSDEEDELEEDGVFLWAKSQIRSGEEWAKQIKQQQHKEAQEQASKPKQQAPEQEQSQGKSKAAFGPSHRQHILQRIREATGVGGEEATFALGEALRQEGPRTATAIIEAACDVVLQRMRAQVKQKLAKAVASKRLTIKLRKPSDVGDGSESEREAGQDTKSIKRKRPEEQQGATVAATKQSRMQEPLPRQARRAVAQAHAAAERKAKIQPAIVKGAAEALDRRQQAAISKRGGITSSPPTPRPSLGGHGFRV